MNWNLPPEYRRMLLDIAVGQHNSRREHRFRNIHTGDTVTQLDLREHDRADWVGESRTVIESTWRERP